jgi:hypothetical protein
LIYGGLVFFYITMIKPPPPQKKKKKKKTSNLHPPEIHTQATHSMTTRPRTSTINSLQKMNHHNQLSTTHDLEPNMVTQAPKNPKWHHAMSDEYDALVQNGTWHLVPPETPNSSWL